MTEVPRTFVSLLRCPRDGGQLSICREDQSSIAGITDGTLRCDKCSAEYFIENGVARLMIDMLTEEGRHEMALKDAEYDALPDNFEPTPSGWRSAYGDYVEIPPHLEELSPLEDCKVLELGCGDGRLTLLMAQLGAQVLAVDFSLAALNTLARRLSSGLAPTAYRVGHRYTSEELAGRVGLVQADASHFHAAPHIFDRALSATPLDSRDERMRMYRSVAESMTDHGRYVAGVEHDDYGRRLLGMPVVKRYTQEGIFVEHLSIEQMRCEAAPYFSRLRFRLIRAHVPFVKHFLPTMLAVRVARTVSAIPVLKQLGEIVLLSAEQPIRPPLEGVRRPGSTAAKRLYRWYKRVRREEPIWDPGEVV